MGCGLNTGNETRIHCMRTQGTRVPTIHSAEYLGTRVPRDGTYSGTVRCQMLALLWTEPKVLINNIKA
eukprot:1758434-Rhodomonas_salina.2